MCRQEANLFFFTPGDGIRPPGGSCYVCVVWNLITEWISGVYLNSSGEERNKRVQRHVLFFHAIHQWLLKSPEAPRWSKCMPWRGGDASHSLFYDQRILWDLFFFYLFSPLSLFDVADSLWRHAAVMRLVYCWKGPAFKRKPTMKNCIIVESNLYSLGFRRGHTLTEH